MKIQRLTVISIVTFIISVSAYPLTLKFVREISLPTSTVFEGVPVGGLSGVTYDAKNRKFIAISDDRADKGPSRYYEFSINNELNSVTILKSINLKDQKGNLFTKNSTDFEAITLLPDNTLIITSEGDRDKKIPTNLTHFTREGKYLRSYNLPPEFNDFKKNRGVENNKALESLTSTSDGKYLFTANETPLLHKRMKKREGKVETLSFLKYRVDTNQLILEKTYDYPIISEVDKKHERGLVDLIALSDTELLSLERSFDSSNKKAHAQIYHLSLHEGNSVITKKLLFDLDTLIPQNLLILDNIEGMTIFNHMKTGDRYLLLISDNNFAFFQKNQFIIFKVE